MTNELIPFMGSTRTCYLCGGTKAIKRDGRVRDNPTLEVMECARCGLVYLSSFSHVTEGFYEDGRMHAGEISIDVEAWIREAERDDERRFHWIRPLIEGKSVLDFGCGAGMFLKQTTGTAKRAMGIEPEKKLEGHFLKEGLNVVGSLAEVTERFDVITLFHVLEHLPDPSRVLRGLLSKLKEHGEMIIEVPNANDALLTLYRSKPFSEFTYWSCHLFLFTKSTLSLLAEKAGLRVNYIRQVQRYPLANHLHWLAMGKPGGHKEWHFMNSEELNLAYEKQLASIDACDTLLGSFSRKDR